MTCCNTTRDIHGTGYSPPPLRSFWPISRSQWPLVHAYAWIPRFLGVTSSFDIHPTTEYSDMQHVLHDQSVTRNFAFHLLHVINPGLYIMLTTLRRGNLRYPGLREHACQLIESCTQVHEPELFGGNSSRNLTITGSTCSSQRTEDVTQRPTTRPTWMHNHIPSLTCSKHTYLSVIKKQLCLSVIRNVSVRTTPATIFGTLHA